LWGRWGQGWLAADGLLGPDRLDLDLTTAALPLGILTRVYPDLQAEQPGSLSPQGQHRPESGPV